ncbi:Pimeloyl-ACP methyl ester carboxylesterase [Halobiforma haloterrestris]|uniref:Pimeloyl-ACP methyl ester carboxylesterase n=2 Tax=Natronobacterium haloterrestre TaxID=148448 RepID=A0A1I1K021_NATHA|nr:Pimeloyl-ACP methyl ester carboxylesterase [Halobiforma haloterrestris]
MVKKADSITSEHTGASRPDSHVPLPNVSSIESSFREVNGVCLHVVAAGDPDDPLVVLLHGFPEFWYEWHDYIEPLIDAGYRVLVPDQRGYNRSEKLPGIRPYRITELSEDIVDLIATEDCDSAHVIGHDFGAAIGWDLALRHPDAVERLGIINVPHPTVFERVLTSNLTQLRNSWYMFFLQLPRLPEWYLGRNDYEFLVATMREKAQSGTFDETDFERYQTAWAADGAVKAMINWYRALFRHGEEPPRERVRAPTLIIWGENDQALIPEMAPESLDYCDSGSLERISDGTHWVPHEYPGRITDLLLTHLKS